jgi:hypothetical protein
MTYSIADPQSGPDPDSEGGRIMNTGNIMQCPPDLLSISKLCCRSIA